METQRIMNKALPKEFTGDGLYIRAKAGIYAIVNPVGEIYIGQSTELEERVRKHKKTGGCSGLLKWSMFKYGRKNHKYFLVKELDENAARSAFLEWEKFYIKKYKELGYVLLNANGGGNGGTKGGPGSKDRKLLYQLDYDKYKQPL